MRIKFAVVFAALFMSLGLVAVTSLPASAAAGVSCSIGGLDSAADSLQTYRKRLSSNRTWSYWSARLATVNSLIDQAQSCYSGTANTTIQSYQNSFNQKAQNRSYGTALTYVDGIINGLRTTISNFNRTGSSIWY